MKILALELSTTRGSLAWLYDNVEVAREWLNDRQNSAAFFENLDALTNEFGDPETIIVGLGPGSYAGTRIAISAAIGLQLSSGARLIGFPSVCAIECDADEYCAIGDARRKSFFFARIRGHELIEGPMLYSEAEMNGKLKKLESTMPISSSDPLPQFERAVVRYPSALVLARVARESGRSFFLPPLEPIYLREPHITVPKMETKI
ncbi:MAG: tRNA (adenosine(37)-N6)-threonylcarbamoyltransferase complex dimerization subunit type 1 TsaB [Verrucomicrobia bacterium]|nr:MAG: tRNA (adenosine(37)-N6)-threonylcarbamoyltransferase complex dimerization subunit type 1 TsaB [Verrucomicrobiota bacterium]PYJ91317.1 MAG: tRNA (adenosine(37)-N6)-threonylcarbamoyltransferase complex dimerization subunit type 1 TsaB [Verrucomicrobiota bacterium]